MLNLGTPTYFSFDKFVKKVNFQFSPTRPSGPSWSSTRYVRLWSPFHEAYFAPTTQSRMSKIFRDSESLGKSAGKKWSQN